MQSLSAALLASIAWAGTGPAFAVGPPPLRSDAVVELYREDGSVLASLTVELAETDEARERGLMGRESLDPGTGMLFLYPKPRETAFWMRNTPVSLDILFVGVDDRVLHIAHSTTPSSDEPYASKGVVKCVVETRAGFVRRLGIAVGTRIGWRRRGPG